MLLAVRTVMLQEVDEVAVTSMVPAGGAGQDLISNSTVLLKRLSRMQSPVPPPHLCGGPEGFPVNELTYSVRQRDYIHDVSLF